MNLNEKKKLKGVVVGTGYFSQFHFDAWNQIADVELSAVCDINAQSADRQARTNNISRSYTNYIKMLDEEQPDFVDIITRPETHLELCQAAASRGIAILCQKPLTPSYQESKDLIQLISEANVPFMVHDNFRFQPWHREIKKLINAGEIGDRLLSIEVRSRMGDGWQQDAYMNRQPYFRTMPQLLIHETGVHFIDVFRYLFGDVTSVYANLRQLNPEIVGEDTASVLLSFESGAQGLINATRYHESDAENARYTFGEFLIDGSAGSISLALDGTITIKRLGEPSCVHVYLHEDKGFAGNCVLTTLQHFTDQLLAEKPFETDGEDYLKTLAVQEAIYQSGKQKRLVDLSEIECTLDCSTVSPND
ncbi:MAG: dehydrogenase [Alphaproteobacteria bacterium]|nr:MAG: dehydrogenase [Alphaproteobacteria bacterium]